MSLKPEINFYGGSLATLYAVLYGPDPMCRMGHPGGSRFFMDRQWYPTYNEYSLGPTWTMSTRRVHYMLWICRSTGYLVLNWSYKRSGRQSGRFQLPLPLVTMQSGFTDEEVTP